MVMDELVIKIGANVQSVKDALASIGESAGNLGKDVKEKMAPVRQALQDATPYSNMVAVALGGVATAAMGLGTKAVIMAAQMEQSKIAFTTMLGSAGAAEAMLKNLWDFAATTPFEFPQLQAAAKQLLAFGFNAQEVIPVMKSVGDAAAGLGMGAEGIQRIIYALGQMRAAGRITGDDMRQLAQAGIPAWQILADSIGKSVPEAMKLAQQGAIDSGAAINALIKGMGEKFPDMMKQQSTTMLGLWSTLQDNLGGILRKIGEEIVETFDLKGKLQTALEALGEFADSVNKLGVGNTLKLMFSEETKATIVLIAGAITGMLIPSLIALAQKVIAFTATMGPWAYAGMVIAAVAYEVYTNWDKIVNWFKQALANMQIWWLELVNAWHQKIAELKQAFWGLVTYLLEKAAALATLLPGKMGETFKALADEAKKHLDAAADDADDWARRTGLAVEMVKAKYSDHEATGMGAVRASERLGESSMGALRQVDRLTTGVDNATKSLGGGSGGGGMTGGLQAAGQAVDEFKVRMGHLEAQITLVEKATKGHGDATEANQQKQGLLKAQLLLVQEEVARLEAALAKQGGETGKLTQAKAELIAKLDEARIKEQDLKNAIDGTTDSIQGQMAASIKARDEWIKWQIKNTGAVWDFSAPVYTNPNITGLPQGLASGTPEVTQSGVFDVGESGRERVFLPKGSAVVPVGGAGDEGNVHVHFHGPIIADKYSIRQLVRQIQGVLPGEQTRLALGGAK
jgi:tape measure domain-containing protein